MKISALPLKANPTGDEGVLILDSDGKAKRSVIGALVNAAVSGAVALVNGYRTEAKGYRDEALGVSALVQALLAADVRLPYLTVSSGLGATAPNGFFYVASGGDVFTTLYQKVNGVAVLVNILPGASALDRIGRSVPNLLNADNAASINAALNLVAVGGVYLPVADIRLDRPIRLPSAKFCIGAGIDATQLIRTGNINPATLSLDQAAICTIPGAIGTRMSDFTIVNPKDTGLLGTKMTGVWLRETKHSLVERIKCLDAGYAFFAQEFSQYCVLRNLQSFNANVHYETTRAFDILFEDILSGDGDGDNPLGCEAVLHTLFESKRVTFRHARHKGKGHFIYVVADSVSGDGRIDDIVFDDCIGTDLDTSIAVFGSKINPAASIGKVTLRNVSQYGAGIPFQFQLGDWYIDGGNVATTAQEGMIAYGGARVVANNLNWKMDAPVGASGSIYAVDDGGSILVNGGRVEVTTDVVTLSQGKNVHASGVNFIRPGKIYGPTAIGEVCRYVYDVDQPRPDGYGAFGQTVPGQPQTVWIAASGFRYRMTIRGRIKKTGTNGSLYIEYGTAQGEDRWGYLTIDNADGTVRRHELSAGTPADVDQVRQFRIDLEVTGGVGGSGIVPTFGGGEPGTGSGATVLKGMSIEIERIE